MYVNDNVIITKALQLPNFIVVYKNTEQLELLSDNMIHCDKITSNQTGMSKIRDVWDKKYIK